MTMPRESIGGAQPVIADTDGPLATRAPLRMRGEAGSLGRHDGSAGTAYSSCGPMTWDTLRCFLYIRIISPAFYLLGYRYNPLKVQIIIIIRWRRGIAK